MNEIDDLFSDKSITRIENPKRVTEGELEAQIKLIKIATEEAEKKRNDIKDRQRTSMIFEMFIWLLIPFIGLTVLAFVATTFFGTGFEVMMPVFIFFQSSITALIGYLVGKKSTE